MSVWGDGDLWTAVSLQSAGSADYSGRWGGRRALGGHPSQGEWHLPGSHER